MVEQLSLDSVWDYLRMLEFTKHGEVLKVTHLEAVCIYTRASVQVLQW